MKSLLQICRRDRKTPNDPDSTVQLLSSCSRCLCPRATGHLPASSGRHTWRSLFHFPQGSTPLHRSQLPYHRLSRCLAWLACTPDSQCGNSRLPESLDGFSSFHEWRSRRKDLSVGRIYTVDLVKVSLAYNVVAKTPVRLEHCSANVVRRNHIHLPIKQSNQQDRLRRDPADPTDKLRMRPQLAN